MARRHQGADDDTELADALTQVSGWLTTNVRKYRTRRGLTQESLAETVGTATTYIARIEGSPVNISLRFLVALSRALGCRPGDLLRPTITPNRRAPGRPRQGRRSRPT